VYVPSVTVGWPGKSILNPSRMFCYSAKSCAAAGTPIETINAADRITFTRIMDNSRSYGMQSPRRFPLSFIVISPIDIEAIMVPS
jgi:hypothetical protein